MFYFDKILARVQKGKETKKQDIRVIDIISNLPDLQADPQISAYQARSMEIPTLAGQYAQCYIHDENAELASPSHAQTTCKLCSVNKQTHEINSLNRPLKVQPYHIVDFEVNGSESRVGLVYQCLGMIG